MSRRALMAWAVLIAGAVCALSACSLLFPHAERAIEPQGATLNELGIALLADIERWVDAIIFLLGILG